MLNGKKTYIGIAVAAVGLLLGWLGIGGQEEASELVNAGAETWVHVIEFAGLLVATYGRWAAKPKK